MKSVCIYCGSSAGRDPVYAEMAVRFSTLLAREGITVVYGGGNVGLMGICADAALSAGGRVIGVIPEDLLRREIAHRGVTELHVVKTMHERKALMAERSDAFAALPGGFGTLDELCEMVTWGQLGHHVKPCGLLNLRGYYDGLLAQVNRAVEEGFTKPEHRTMLRVADTPEALLEALRSYRPAYTPKWITPEAVKP